MFARLSAKAVLLVLVLGLVFVGVGLIGMAIAIALTALFGAAGAYAITGAVFVIPPLIWAVAVQATKPVKQEPPPGARQMAGAIMAALAKETPWVAILGTALAGAANMFLSRNKSKK